MKSSSLGPLLIASALSVAPTLARADDPVDPASAAVTPVAPAPAATDADASAQAPTALQPPASTPTAGDASAAPGSSTAASPTPGLDAPQALDPVGATTPPSARRRRNAADGGGAGADPVPDVQATDPSLIGPGALDVQAVPNFFIEDFDIPPFLIPIYQAAGSEYGIRWEVLAAINRVETAFGTNLNVSSAGALGWMQFMPSTWEQYGVDANGDGEKDPFNPADAIFAAARYLKAAGGDTDLRKAVYSYNHADWYVDEVMNGASQIASIPEPIISSLAALTQGIFPVDAADRSIDYRGKLKASTDKNDTVAPGDDASDTVSGNADANSIDITAPAGSRVVATQDGVVEKVGHTDHLGTYVRLRDAYGNRYTYAHLGNVQDKVPVPKPVKDKDSKDQTDDAHASDDEPSGKATRSDDQPAATTPAADATDTTPTSTTPDASPTPAATATSTPTPAPTSTTMATPKADGDAAPPHRRGPRAHVSAVAETAGAAPHLATPEYARRDLNADAIDGTDQAALTGNAPTPDASVDAIKPTGPLAEYFSIDYGLKPSDVRLVDLQAGTHVIASTVLGRMARDTASAQLTFKIQPAGSAAPYIDPKPILDGWRLMDKTAFYKAQQQKAVEAGTESDDTSAGQVLLMSKAELTQRVLADKRISIYACGIRDIKAGLIDRRILALLEYLAIKDVKPVVTALECGHSLMTSSGNISEHSTGSAVDIGSVYDTVISPATQGQGSVTDRAVQEILKLQGAMKPHQIITLMQYAGTDNTLALPDHYNHIHVGYRPESGNGGKQLQQLLQPGQWNDLLQQLSSLKVPNVSAGPSKYSVDADHPHGTTPAAEDDAPATTPAPR